MLAGPCSFQRLRRSLLAPPQFWGPQALLSVAAPLRPAASLCVSSHQDTSQQSQGRSTCMTLPSWGPSRIKSAETCQKVSEVPGGRAWGHLVNPLQVTRPVLPSEEKLPPWGPCSLHPTPPATPDSGSCGRNSGQPSRFIIAFNPHDDPERRHISLVSQSSRLRCGEGKNS